MYFSDGASEQRHRCAEAIFSMVNPPTKIPHEGGVSQAPIQLSYHQGMSIGQGAVAARGYDNAMLRGGSQGIEKAAPWVPERDLRMT